MSASNLFTSLACLSKPCKGAACAFQDTAATASNLPIVRMHVALNVACLAVEGNLPLTAEYI